MNQNSLCRLIQTAACLFLLALPLEGYSCTLWGGAGDDVGSGTMISKNRDWKPDHVQLLKINRSGKYAYLGLYAKGNDAPGLKEGVNEKGLAVVSATAGSIPSVKRKAQKGKGNLMGTLLSEYADCDQVLADKDALFSNRKPAYLMISDTRKIIMLEVGLLGRFSVTVATSGTVVHSNHYVGDSLLACNEKIGRSSTARLQRISQLLQTTSRPLSMESFVEMSQDRHDGANNSLWRTGTGSCTLSSWILRTPSAGPPTLRVLIADRSKPEQLEKFVLDEKFWRQPPAVIGVSTSAGSNQDAGPTTPIRQSGGDRHASGSNQRDAALTVGCGA